MFVVAVHQFCGLDGLVWEALAHAPIFLVAGANCMSRAPQSLCVPSFVSLWIWMCLGALMIIYSPLPSLSAKDKHDICTGSSAQKLNHWLADYVRHSAG